MYRPIHTAVRRRASRGCLTKQLQADPKKLGKNPKQTLPPILVSLKVVETLIKCPSEMSTLGDNFLSFLPSPLFLQVRNDGADPDLLGSDDGGLRGRREQQQR